MVIPPTKLPIDEIISIEPTLLNTEAVPSQDSVKISGDITASMLYTSNESSVPEVFDIDIPFDGMIETEDVEPNMEINTDLTITDFTMMCQKMKTEKTGLLIWNLLLMLV